MEVAMKFKLTEAATTEFQNVLDTKKDPNRYFRVYVRGYS